MPCGHSVCIKCSQALDAKATQSPELAAAKFCPMCTQQRTTALAAGGGDDSADLTPIENFPNTMLDAVLSRLRTKVQDVQTLLNFVVDIFEFGGTPLPGADALRASIAPSPAPSTSSQKAADADGAPTE